MAKFKNKNLEKLIRDYLNSAKERIESAEQLLKIGNFRDSISRAYYAYLDAADALLLTNYWLNDNNIIKNVQDRQKGN